MNGEAIRALLLLSQRHFPGTRRWFMNSQVVDGWKCCVCDKDIVRLRDGTEIIAHGMDHLKERGLLIFI